MHEDEEAGESHRADACGIAKLEATLRDTRRRAAFASVTSKVLLSASLDLEQVLERLTQLAVPAIADGCIVYLADALGQLDRHHRVAHADPDKQARLQHFLDAQTPRRDPELPGGAHDVFRTSATTFHARVSEATLQSWAQDDAQLRELRAIAPRSVVIVPMVAQGVSLGVVCFGTTDEREYEEEDITMFSDLGEKAALAVHNAASYASERRARERIELLQGLSTELASSLSSGDVARTIVAHGVALGASGGAIWEVEPDGQRAQLRYASASAHEWQALLPSPTLGGDDMIGRALRRNEAVFVHTVEEYTAAFPHEQDQRPPWRGSALVCVPLVVGERRLAVLAFAFGGARPPGPDERASLVIAAGHAAQALSRIRLYEAEQRARTEVGLLYGLLDAFNSAPTLDDLLQRALDTVLVGLGVERTSILLFDEQEVMRFRAARGLSAEYCRAVEGHSPWSKTSPDPQPLAVPDVMLDPTLEAIRATFQREGIAALAFVPLVHRGELLGKFMVYSAVPRSFSQAELRLAGAIASQIAQGVARKIAETRAAEARLAAERANRLKDEFLAVVSHELRTPLSSIVGWASVLLDPRGVEAGTLRKGLEVIERSARTQARIIGDILDVSRIVSGKLVIEQDLTSLVTVAEQALDAARPSARAKRIVLDFEHDDEPYPLVGDADRLQQVAWNLLSNAIKFTPLGGRVAVRLRRELSAIVLEVQDSGIGIDVSFLPHAFERFRQADSSTTRREGGLGLGLAIVRHLVELHGGRTEVSSGGVGKGSTFRVVLPVRATQPPGPPTAEARAAEHEAAPPMPVDQSILDGIRVLVVDDESDARELVRQALGSYGASVETAGSASECMKALSTFHPDVLVSDIAMPEQDGVQLITELRKRVRPSSLPAIALTALAAPDDVKRALAAGFQGHVSKPAEPAALARTIRGLRR